MKNKLMMIIREAVTNFALAVFIWAFFNSSATGHFHHGHGHQRHDVGDDHHIESSTASDFTASGPADVFDSCLIACYVDIVARYGEVFAEQLKLDGFVFKKCLDEGINSTEVLNVTVNDSYSSNQRALNRILGATNQLNRIWNIESYRSLDGILRIPYKIKTTEYFNQETIDTIEAALRHIEQATGVIKFITRTEELEYIYFTYETYYSGICAANLGKQFETSTKIYLGWCRQSKHKGSIIHETLHALGFWHEHSRPDRDDFITIQWANIAIGSETNFAKAQEVNSLGSPYDFTSIMHYPSNAFAIDSTSKTILNRIALSKWEVMGQRVQLSENDVDQLRLLYQCKSGPRAGTIGVNDLCSIDCKCWEYAPGECTSDDECMGDLVCRNTPNPLPIKEYKDQLPTYPFISGTISCSEFCHSLCCNFPDNVVACPQTCNTAPPISQPAVIPSKMCMIPNGGGATTSSTVATTTRSTTSNNAKWYIDWSISKCVQNCVGSPPCGGLGMYVLFHDTLQQCCSAHLYWTSFSNCHTIPNNPLPSKLPTKLPTPLPSPSKMPSKITTKPTPNPPTKPPTSLPSLATKPTVKPIVVSNLPTLKPTVSPTMMNKPTIFPSITTAPPTHRPTTNMPSKISTLKPTLSPTIMNKPTVLPSIMTPPPTHRPTTNMPSKIPTLKPTLSPTIMNKPTALPSIMTTPPTHKPTTQLPSKIPTFQPVSVTNVVKAVFYIDWDISKCVQDCVGPAPCGGPKPAWSAGYSSVDICCSTMPWKPFKDCSNVPLGSLTTKVPTKNPSQSPTVKPTLWPTPPPAFKSPTFSPSTQPSSLQSTKPLGKPFLPTLSPPSSSPSQRLTSKPVLSKTDDSLWYPSTNKCSNDGNAPSWMVHLYKSQSLCCSSHFNWDYNNCLGLKQQSSFKWWANWAVAKCVQDCEANEGASCGGLVPGTYVLLHNSPEACCVTHMSYLPVSQCRVST